MPGRARAASDENFSAFINGGHIDSLNFGDVNNGFAVANGNSLASEDENRTAQKKIAVFHAHCATTIENFGAFINGGHVENLNFGDVNNGFAVVDGNCRTPEARGANSDLNF